METFKALGLWIQFYLSRVRVLGIVDLHIRVKGDIIPDIGILLELAGCIVSTPKCLPPPLTSVRDGNCYCCFAFFKVPLTWLKSWKLLYMQSSWQGKGKKQLTLAKKRFLRDGLFPPSGSSVSGIGGTIKVEGAHRPLMPMGHRRGTHGLLVLACLAKSPATRVA